MTKEQIDAVLAKVRSWPEEDQAELAEAAQAIEARRTGLYKLTEDERHTIASAREGRLASEHDVDAFWKRHGLA